MIRGVGIVWYRNEEDFRAAQVMFGKDTLPHTYEEWLERAVKALEEYASEGQQVVKAYLDPKTFPEWCKRNKLKVNRDSRTIYGGCYAHAADPGWNPYSSPAEMN